jgi:hypothetical protein
VKKIIAVAATSSALLAGLVAGVSQSPASAATSSSTVTARHCQVLRTLPAYVYRYQGATVYEPTGAARYREVLTDGLRGDNLQRVCRAQVNQQVESHGASAPTLVVLRELGYR